MKENTNTVKENGLMILGISQPERM